MPRRTLLSLFLLSAFLSFSTAAPVSANTTCTEISRGFFDRDIELCFKNTERIDCNTYCNHLPSRITEMAGDRQAIKEFDPGRHAGWQQCYKDYQLPCENRRDQGLNDCLIYAQDRFHTRWLACPDSTNSMPPLMPNALFRN